VTCGGAIAYLLLWSIPSLISSKSRGLHFEPYRYVAHYRSHKIVPSSSHSEGLLLWNSSEAACNLVFEPARISRVLSNIGWYWLFFQTREVAPCFWEIHRPSFSLFSLCLLWSCFQVSWSPNPPEHWLLPSGNLSRTPPSDMTVLETFRPGDASMIYAESQIPQKGGRTVFHRHSGHLY